MQLVLTELASTGWQFKGTIPLSLLQDKETGEIIGSKWVCSDVQCSVDLRPEHDDFYLDVTWKFKAEDRCMRCQDVTIRSYEKAITRCFSFTVDDEKRDKIEKPGELNVLDFLREEIWLAQNQSLCCHAACKGLCANCGVNLNHEKCRCDGVDVLHPFAGLRSVKF